MYICTSTLFRPSDLLESSEFNPSLIQRPSLSHSTLMAGQECSRIHNHVPILQLLGTLQASRLIGSKRDWIRHRTHALDNVQKKQANTIENIKRQGSSIRYVLGRLVLRGEVVFLLPEVTANLAFVDEVKVFFYYKQQHLSANSYPCRTLSQAIAILSIMQIHPPKGG